MGLLKPSLFARKYVATGNDFLFIDARQGLPEFIHAYSRGEIAKKICDRNFGVGADGAVFVEESKENGLLKWDFFNSDGSHAEMCGNATRCMGRWVEDVLGKKAARFQTAVGPVDVESQPHAVSSHLSFVRFDIQPIEYVVRGQKRSAHFINTGVPHIVIEIADISDAKNRSDDIQALRYHPVAGPRGSNVTFLSGKTSESFSTVTFERGVEDFTLSCGTGVLAAAAVGLASTGGNEAELSTPGGRLHVSLPPGNKGVVLSGPSRFLFETELTKEFFT